MAQNFFRWNFSRWLRRHLTPHAQRARKQKLAPPKLRPTFEPLEERWLMSVVYAPNMQVQESSGTALVSLTLSGTSAQTVTVDYATSNGSATAGSDYTATSGTASFAPGASGF